MGALSSTAVLERLRAPEIAERLVVTPLLSPKEQLSDGHVGIDVRLGRSFSMVLPWTQGVAEHLNREGPASPPILESVVLDFGQALIIHPHQFVLARTLEFVRLPRDLMAYVIGRSSWGRRGLIVATAVVVHPGFSGPITLELKNVGEVPLALYPLDRVAQLVVHSVDGPYAETTQSSQFASSYSPELGRVRDEETETKLFNIAERLRQK